MCDAEYVFNKDIRDKKRIARGAFNKINGSKSKKCTLPHEFMSRKEIKKMSSEVTSWSMFKFYSWDEFRDMPADLKVEYINRLIDLHDISISVIAKELFNISDGYFRKTLVREKIMIGTEEKSVYEMIHLRNGFRSKKENVDRFKMACKKSLEPPEPEIPEDPEDINPAEMIAKSMENNTATGGAVKVIDEELEELSNFTGTIGSSEIYMDGFDMATFIFLEKKYRGRKIEVIISVNVVEG